MAKKKVIPRKKYALGTSGVSVKNYLQSPREALAKNDILMSKAKIYVKENELTKGTAALKDLITNHNTSIWIDDALFMFADILEKKLNNPEEAKKLYQQLVNDYPGSMFNAEARKRFRNIRGDNVGT